MGARSAAEAAAQLLDAPSTDEAFERLKLTSQRTSIKVRDVAKMIVAQGVEPVTKP